jgi:WD40 repeat protein
VKRLGVAGLASRAQRSTIQDVGGSSNSNISGGLEKAGSAADKASSFMVAKGKTIDLPTDIPELKFRGYGSACFALSFSPDGSRLAGGYFDGCLRIFDVDSQSQVHTLSLARPHDVGVMRYEEGQVQRANQRGSSTLTQPDVAITNVRWIPLARPAILASVDSAGAIGMWDLTKGRVPQLLTKVVTETGELHALDFSRDSTKLLVAGQDCAVKVYDVAMGGGLQKAQTLGQWSGLGKIAGHTLKVLSLRADPACHEVFVSGGLDKQALLWDLRVGESPAAVIQGTELSGDALDICRDGTTLLVGNHRKNSPLQLFDLRMLSPRPGELRACHSYQWSGDVSEAESMATGACCLLFSAAWDAFSNNMIVAAGEKEGMGQIFRRQQSCSETGLEVVARVHGNGSALYSAAMSEDARTAAFGGADGSIRMCDLRYL